MPSASESGEHNPLSHFMNSISSYDSNIMLAAVISLLLVILFVVFLHVYAKWFLKQASQRRRSSSVSVSQVLGPSRLNQLHSLAFDSTSLSSSPSKSGLDASIISSLPYFVYKTEESENGLECVICLNHFEENEVGKSLIKCGHGFHVECIDMWLSSHSNCPICRAPATGDVANSDKSTAASEEQRETTVLSEMGLRDGESGDSRLQETVIEVANSESTVHFVTNDNDSSPETSSSSSNSYLGCSLKRMLSRNRSERKVFPSSNATALDV
ncbi:hypothetical protein K2173_012283 [Erythroxylum novogranatense]|uniref:RING-type E3 ubiquitin transferase n=1 Tax=Erythroxylum novogranatense TaxID=1862640 RepID=A0AAV8SC60_9ROSI|nr:hypothetical protein K2173_012283 [Erythroxylum novogranatense]